ncbi:hypothetical protein SAMN04488030_0674 [Aliiroseovarius halocynthiae]|nr:hypothetical protein SAMN04488030_0674 [Aliiroseovarius halocynthiae]
MYLYMIALTFDSPQCLIEARKCHVISSARCAVRYVPDINFLIGLRRDNVQNPGQYWFNRCWPQCWLTAQSSVEAVQSDPFLIL